MRNSKISVLGLLLIGVFCLTSCDKYKSKITGKVFYTDVNDNVEYPAAGAIITKMLQKGDELHTFTAVVADENGEFIFDHTTKGTWILSGKLTLDIDSVSTVSYFGLSQSITTSGEDNVETTIMLKYVNEEDRE
jgi:hypothetical protein